MGRVKKHSNTSSGVLPSSSWLMSSQLSPCFWAKDNILSISVRDHSTSIPPYGPFSFLFLILFISSNFYSMVTLLKSLDVKIMGKLPSEKHLRHREISYSVEERVGFLGLTLFMIWEIYFPVKALLCSNQTIPHLWVQKSQRGLYFLVVFLNKSVSY